MTADHLLHYTPGAEGSGTWRLECIEGVCPQHSFTEPLKDWPDDKTCRCTLEGNDCKGCRGGDHGGCGYFGAYIDDVGYECRCEQIQGPSCCWTISWFDEQGAWCIVGDDWPEDVLPLPVSAGYDGYLQLTYAPPEATSE